MPVYGFTERPPGCRSHRLALKTPSVVIVEYGLGNLFSVAAALAKIGATQVTVSDDKDEISNADRLIIPGVGAFGDGMENLERRGLVSTIQKYAESGRPVLGVCLGMQLLMTESEEFGQHKGLGLIAGNVTLLDSQGDPNLKIPLIGWNEVGHPNGDTGTSPSWETSVLSKINPGSFMYFLHSYFVEPANPETSLAVTPFGSKTFCSAISQGSITGVQFHPERSGEEGLNIYRSFIFEN